MRLRLGGLLVMLFVAALSVGQTAERPVVAPVKVQINLTDGSVCSGQVMDVEKVTLRTVMGEVEVPVAALAALRLDDQGAKVTARFRNGDRLTGALVKPEVLIVTTDQGRQRVGKNEMAEVHFGAVSGFKGRITATASQSWGQNTPDKAFDDDNETCWNSGAETPQWIEADLKEGTALDSIKLVIEQHPDGATTHKLYISNQPIAEDVSGATLVHTWQGETSGVPQRGTDGKLAEHPSLSYQFPEGTTARYVQIRTTESPSWVAWREIDIRPKEAEAKR